MTGKRTHGLLGPLRAALPKLLLASLLFVAIPTEPVLAADNAAVAINTKDGSSIFKFAFHVHRTMNEVIEETNIAVAFASCEGCQTVAIAIQIVLVMSDPNVIAPKNAAIAINFECTSCETLADAYQFVISADSAALSKEGTKEIIAIRKAFHDLAKRAEAGELSIAEIQAESEKLVTRLREVLTREFRAGEQEDSGAGAPGDDEQEGIAEPEPTASGDQQRSPSPSPSESPMHQQTTPPADQDQTVQPTAGTIP
jgi:putative peptide zinc metalloprotease protein